MNLFLRSVSFFSEGAYSCCRYCPSKVDALARFYLFAIFSFLSVSASAVIHDFSEECMVQEKYLDSMFVSFPDDAEITLFSVGGNAVNVIVRAVVDSCVGGFRSDLCLGNPDVGAEAFYQALNGSGYAIAITYLDDILIDDKLMLIVSMKYDPSTRHLLREERVPSKEGELVRKFVYEVDVVEVELAMTFVFNFKTVRVVRTLKTQGLFSTCLDFG